MVLSLVALIVTIIGFFASLKFYRDGMKTQNLANDALARISEKAESIHSQVGGIFDKTLDAALESRKLLDANFEEINGQLDQMKERIVDSAIEKIGAAGDEERGRLSAEIDAQIAALRRRVKETQENVEDLARADGPTAFFSRAHARTQARILTLLIASLEPKSAGEIADEVGIDLTLVRSLLGRLFNSGLIERYESGDRVEFAAISPDKIDS